MPAKTPTKGKKAAAPKPAKKTVPPKVAKKSAVVDDEATGADDEGDDEEDDDFDDLDGDEEEAPRAAAKPAAAVVPAKKPAAPAPAAKSRTGQPSEDAPAVVPARRLTPEAKAKVNEMVRKGMSLGDALKVAASWETFVAPVKDEPAKLVQGRMSGGGGSGGGGGGEAGPRSNFAGETEPEDLPETGGDDEEPVATED